jgi:GNAT superfamily N-acetyltransferase
LALQQLNAMELGYAVSLELTETKLQKLMKEKDHHFLRVYEDLKTKQVVGYVHAEVYDNLYSETMFNVMGLAVLEAHQQQGIGKQLMDEVELEAKRRNYLAIRLNSGENRSNAHQFYEKMGYQANKMQKRFIKFC